MNDYNVTVPWFRSMCLYHLDSRLNLNYQISTLAEAMKQTEKKYTQKQKENRRKIETQNKNTYEMKSNISNHRREKQGN